MALNVCFYEDNSYKNFYPLTHLKSVYLLRTGMVELFRNTERYFPKAKVTFACRSHLVPLIAESWHDISVNSIKPNGNDVLFINGRLRDIGNLPELVKQSSLSTRYITAENEVVAVFLKPDLMDSISSEATPVEYEQLVKDKAESINTVNSTATLYRHAWDLIADIESAIKVDFKHLRSTFENSGSVKINDAATLVNDKDIFLCDGVEVCPGAVIDASHGPVYVGANTRIESHSAVYGPCYIGDDCIILAGKITGSSIGYGCRVGGEVEESVFHSFVNKYHAGFIGHSYVAPWVNFGAMTTNSDLKNNYSSIRILLNGQLSDTGLIKLGSLIGDHTKFGIGTLLNTGINIGVCCNIFGGNLILDKEIPSFSWGGSDGYTKYHVDKAIETAKVVSQRRHCDLSHYEIDILQSIASGDDSEEGVLEFDPVRQTGGNV